MKDKGFLHAYPAIIKETKIEDIQGKKTIEKVKTKKKETKPPRRYTPASIISELEKRNLGTKATRASIIETLYNRNYIKEQAIQATPLGMQLISTLTKHSPIIIDEKLTRHFEREMSSIQNAKKNITNLQDQTLKEAKEAVTKISEDIEKNKGKIGKDLVKAVEKNYEKEREDKVIGPCPKCKKGNLIIIYNKKYKRYFIGCSGYPKCKTTFGLPTGLINKKTDKTCQHCGFPLLMRIKKGKRPWTFCFNPSCPSNKKWLEKKKN